MKTAVVYYTMSGNARFMAEEISRRTDADLIEIAPVKPYKSKGFMKYVHGGGDVVMKRNPKLKAYTFNAEEYDSVIMVSPVWASSVVPPLRTFADENKAGLQGKKISMAMCQLGNGGEKAMEGFRQYLGIDAFEKTMLVIEPLMNEEKKQAALDEIEKFCG